MRAFVLIVVLALVGAAGVWAQNATNQPSTLTACPAVGDEIADACMAKSLGLSTQQVTQLRMQGMSYSDIATAQAIAMKSGCPLSEVVAHYQTDKNWSDVAKRYNLSMSDIAMVPMVSTPEMEAFNRRFISQYYGIPESQLVQLRQQGFSWDEINLIANASVRTGQPVATIASLRSQGMSWQDIANRYNVALSDLTSPTMRVVVARPIPAGAGPVATTAMYDSEGNVLLTLDHAQRLYKMGYDWLDVAIAANMYDATGIPIRQWLMWIRQGAFWPTLATRYGVPYEFAFDVTRYPFPRTSVYSTEMQERRLAMIQKYQTGAKREPTALGPVMFTPMPSNIP